MTNIRIWASVIVILSAALSACSATPTGVSQHGQAGVDAEPIVSATENAIDGSAATDSGLGPIVYAEPPRAVCKKRRRTGTNRRVSVCEKIVGSQPVRTITEDDSTIIWGAIPASTPANN